MARLPLTFACQGCILGGTLDTAPGTTGLLMVSGGNEIRSGAFNGAARLAQRIARAGFPVFRFDRRGIGDSEGENRGFRKSRKDILAALDAFRAMAPQMGRVIGFGNCDAASALMLTQGAGFDALVLANPWTLDEDMGDAQPASAVRTRYASKLKDPQQVRKLLSGKIDLRKLGKGLSQALGAKTSESSLATEIRSGLQRFEGPVRILLAERDRTAQIFAEVWNAEDTRLHRCPDATHSFSEPHAQDWLQDQLLRSLRG